MIRDLPTYIEYTFGLTTVASLFLFVWTIRTSRSEQTRKVAKMVFMGMIVWLGLQAILSLLAVYSSDSTSFPPKIMILGIFPMISIIILLFTTSKGRSFIDSLPLKSLTYINSIRIPVEMVLFWLYMNKAIPKLMTFEGWNFDIVAGITALFIAYFGISKNRIGYKALLIWNFISLGLLLNIVFLALLSVPSPIQKFAFDQPNIALLYFPFSWLPTFIVPIVLFGHLASIRQLLIRRSLKQSRSE
jgi:hypothetical protein